MKTTKPRTVPRTVAVSAALLLGAVAASCGAEGGPDGATGSPTSGPTSAPTPSAPSASADVQTSAPTPTPSEEPQVRIAITIDDQTFRATLDESAASRDLLAQLPVTVEMSDHNSVEKTGRLPAGLSLEGQPDGADPDVGDVGYYAPGEDLVLYYGDQSYFPGIVVLGAMDAGAAESIAQLDGSVTVRVEEATD